MVKTSEGCNFSWGFGYMRQGSERRDVTIFHPSASTRRLSGILHCGPKHPGPFAVYDTIHKLKTPTGEEEKGRNIAGLQRGKTLGACWVQRNIHCCERRLAASAHGVHRR